MIIDLWGGDDDNNVITIPPEKTAEELKLEEENRRKALEEIFRRAPQPALQIVPVDPGK